MRRRELQIVAALAEDPMVWERRNVLPHGY